MNDSCWWLNKQECHACMHACASLAMRGFKSEEYCHAWLTLGSYSATYNYFIQPVNSQQYWEPTPYDKPVPPPVRRSAGRPKKNRRKDVNEEPIAGQKLKKTYNDTQCSRCGLFGHNTRGCMKQGVTRRPKNWVDSEPEQPAEGNNEVADNVNVAAGGNVNVVAAGNEAGGNVNAMVQHAHAHAGTTAQQVSLYAGP